MFAPLPDRRPRLDALRDVEIALDRAAWDAMMPLRESAPPASPSAWARLRTLALALVLLAALAALVALVGPVMS